MQEKEQYQLLNSQMVHCINSVKKIEIALLGDEYNEGLISQHKKLTAKIEQIEANQHQQRGGINVGKWLLGTTLGAYLLSQIEVLQNFVKGLFKQ